MRRGKVTSTGYGDKDDTSRPGSGKGCRVWSFRDGKLSTGLGPDSYLSLCVDDPFPVTIPILVLGRQTVNVPPSF